MNYQRSVTAPTGSKFLPPAAMLEDYLNYYSDPPPLAVVLDSIIRDDIWRDASLVWREKNFPDVHRYQIEYHSLFVAVHQHLKTLARQKQVPGAAAEPPHLKNSVIPSVFRKYRVRSNDGRLLLPDEARLWIEEERARTKLAKTREDLANTFLILIALGAFGSLIFLIRDFMEAESTRLAAYLFRPLWGMFLALAIFILDIWGHAMLSESGLANIRHETLFALALAAGLLSEQAYQYVVLRVTKLLREHRLEDPEPPENGNGPDENG